MAQATRTPPHVLTLILLTGVSTLSLNMFLPSLSNIAAELQVDYALVNLSIAGYAASTAILQLIMGPLSDRYGRRPVLLVSIMLFIAASFGCFMATEIWTFLAFRMLQGAIISGWVISTAVVRDMKPPQEAASLLGYISMAMAVAPMLGPMVGGVLDETFGWRSSFLVFCGLGTAIFLLCWMDLGETNLTPSQTFAAQFRAYPELLRSRRFWGYAVCMASTTAAFYSFLGGIPLVTRQLFDMSTAMLGFYMGITTVGFFVGSYLSGRFSRHTSLTTMMLFGRGIACLGLAIGLLAFATVGVSVFSLFGPALCVGLGNGLTLPSTSAGAMSVRPQLAGSAAGLSGALTLTGGATASALTGIILTDTNGPWALLGVMFFVSAVGLLSALYVRWLDRIEPLVEST